MSVEDRFLPYLRDRLGDVSFARPLRRLTGGFVTDVYGFELTRAPKSWSCPLVLRVYPDATQPHEIHRERCAQEVVASQGLPAPQVLACELDPSALGRRFMVMRLMPGQPLQGSAVFPRIVLDLPKIIRTLPVVTAATMRAVHRLDPAPLLDALAASGIDRRQAGIDHWLDGAASIIDEWSFDGLRGALEWLRINRPPETDGASICHGDLWGANILVDRRTVTGILDWNLVTIACPEFEIGGQLANLEMAPIQGPAPIRRIARSVGSTLAGRLQRAYDPGGALREDVVRYFSVMRAFTELTFKLSVLARMRATGETIRAPSWIPEQCADYICTRTSVPVTI